MPLSKGQKALLGSIVFTLASVVFVHWQREYDQQVRHLMHCKPVCLVAECKSSTLRAGKLHNPPSINSLTCKANPDELRDALHESRQLSQLNSMRIDDIVLNPIPASTLHV